MSSARLPRRTWTGTDRRQRGTIAKRSSWLKSWARDRSSPSATWRSPRSAASVARVERYDATINAVVVRDVDRARKRARAADRALHKGESWGPFHGLPMTVKESYDVAGLPTTWGLPSLRDRIAGQNATVVDRLLGAGAVIFGKTFLPSTAAPCGFTADGL